MKRPIVLVAFALAAGIGCTQSEDDACAKDQVYDNGACRPKPAGVSGSGGDAGSPAEPTDGGSAPSAGGSSSEGGSDAAPADVAFGATCDTHADCGGATDYCAKGPTAPPYCTAKDCNDNEDICPEGWECFDVSLFVPGEPWICNQPTM